jgi:YHS domain-containing protein
MCAFEMYEEGAEFKSEYERRTFYFCGESFKAGFNMTLKNRKEERDR